MQTLYLVLKKPHLQKLSSLSILQHSTMHYCQKRCYFETVMPMLAREKSKLYLGTIKAPMSLVARSYLDGHC